MDNDIKTVLIIIVFVLIVILLFRPQNANGKEHYDAAFDSQYVDPRVNPYSRNIAYRPDTDKHFVLDDVANTDPDKIFDHLEDQNRGLNEYDDNFDTNPKHDRIFSGRYPYYNDKPVFEGRISDDEQFEKYRESLDSYLEDTKKYNDNPHYRSSYNNTQVNSDPKYVTNNIVKYCVKPSTSKMNMIADRPYTKSSPLGKMDLVMGDIDRDDNEFYDLVSNVPNNKTYVDIDKDYGRYTTKNNNKMPSDINNLAELTDVMDAYRKDTLNTIQGVYRNSEYTIAGKCGKNMNERLD